MLSPDATAGLFVPEASGYHARLTLSLIVTMRSSSIALALFAMLLAACSTPGNIPPSKHISQSGPLKVHPGLLTAPTAEAPADKQR